MSYAIVVYSSVSTKVGNHFCWTPRPPLCLLPSVDCYAWVLYGLRFTFLAHLFTGRALSSVSLSVSLFVFCPVPYLVCRSVQGGIEDIRSIGDAYGASRKRHR